MIKKFNKSVKIVFIIILGSIITFTIYKFNNGLHTVIKVDKNNKKVESLKPNKSKTETTTNIEEKKQNQQVKISNKNISKEDAINIIMKKFPGKGESHITYEYDHDSSHYGKEFYVIHVFENMKTHTATIGWFGVDKTTGKIYNEILGKYED